MVQGHRFGKLAAEIESGPFKILSGVKSEIGGDNEGPGPHELLEASLAACTIITLQMYANRKNLKLKSANVEVKVISETPEGAVISRKISLEGELTDEEAQRLIQIANKCPIHNLLTHKIEILTERVDL